MWSTLHITADYRERPSGLIDLLQRQGVTVKVKHVRHGDYVIKGCVTVERKTAKDFTISLIDGRLFRQLSDLVRYCRNPIVLIEGDPYDTGLHVHGNAVKGALLSTQVIWRVPVVFSASKEDSRDILLMMARQCAKHVDVIPQRGGYRPAALKSRQLYILQGLPGIGPELSKRLIRHFRSVVRVMNASIEELTQVHGVGTACATKIRGVLDSRL
ncbi:MAG: hypothetical protein JRI36_13810 [Deltaproteobacteria bacterium]|nr:hypothetical protein [Deltaproteobacteria bacterium]